jgi:hypothetical protein
MQILGAFGAGIFIFVIFYALNCQVTNASTPEI